MKDTLTNPPDADGSDTAGNSKVETILHEGELLCIVIPARPQPQATTFYTPAEAPVQVGKIVYAAGSRVAPHKHRHAQRPVAGNTEVIWVQNGKAIVDVFANDDTHVCTRELGAGDVIVLFDGGHGFRFLSDTVLVEVRRGPFDGINDKQGLP